MNREFFYLWLLQYIQPEWDRGLRTDQIRSALCALPELSEVKITEGLIANALAWGRDNGKLTARAA